MEVALVGRGGAIGGIVSSGDVPGFANSEFRAGGRFLRLRISAIAQIFSNCSQPATLVTPFPSARPNGCRRRKPDARHRFEVTQEPSAEMLGVGPTFITRTLRQLRNDGVIKTKRRVFIVEDEAALRTRSCACTTAIEDHFDTVLHGIPGKIAGIGEYARRAQILPQDRWVQACATAAGPRRVCDWGTIL